MADCRNESEPLLPAFAFEQSRREGAPWLTFVPGIGNDKKFWAVQANALAAQYQILVFDPWGHGASPLPPEPCSFDMIIGGLLQLWDKLGIERSSLVGLGFGGSVCLAAAAFAPQRVDKVVACCCRARQPDDRRQFWRERSQKAAEIGIDAMAEVTVDKWLTESFRIRQPEVGHMLREMFSRTSLQGYAVYTAAFAEMDFSSFLNQITAPVLLLAGEHDKGGGPPADMKEMADEIPYAKFQIVEDAGHIINYENPKAVNSILSNFLGSIR